MKKLWQRLSAREKGLVATAAAVLLLIVARSFLVNPYLEHRDWVKEKKCPSCLSPCQMKVAAVKQVAQYVKFLVRASAEKRKHSANLEAKI